MADEVLLFADGACRGNPGPSGAGVFITTGDGDRLVEKAVYLGEGTNNVAEYQALIIGLEALQALDPVRVTIKMDSELVVRQVNGVYRVRNPRLIPLFQRAKELLGGLGEVRIVHIRREYNRDADRLANQAIDEHAGG